MIYIRIIFCVLFCATVSLHPMDAWSTDFVTRCLIDLLGQDARNDAERALVAQFAILKQYDNKLEKPILSGVSVLGQLTVPSLKKSYRKLSMWFHPDKRNNDDLDIKIINQANETLAKNNYGDLQAYTDRYARVFAAVRPWSQAIKYGILVCVPAIGYRIGKLYQSLTPTAAIDNIRQAADKTVNFFKHCMVDRFTSVDAFTCAAQVDVSRLLSVLPDELRAELIDTIKEFDSFIAESFHTFAWKYYDCVTYEELCERDQKLTTALVEVHNKLHRVLDACKQELVRQNRTIITRMFCAAGILISPMILVGIRRIGTYILNHLSIARKSSATDPDILLL